MKSVICKQGETQPGTMTVTLERGGLTLVIEGVPARICDNCGEEYVDERVAEQLLATLDQPAQAGFAAARPVGAGSPAGPPDAGAA